MISLLLLCGTVMHAQQLTGKVFGKTEEGREILPGATVHWLGTTSAVMVNENGVFEISNAGITDQRLVASFAGYIADTIAAEGKTYISFTLKKEATDLSAVVVQSNRGFIKNDIGKVELISRKELSKAACCDLAGCFGTQASVQAHTTNVVTNAQELRILGLSGVYNQLLVDGLPMLQGATYTYGVSSYPGTVIENIYVSKGNTSVLQGYESISGQINLETRQPGNTDKLHLNAYTNSFGEKHLNANISTAVDSSKKWNTMLALHVVLPSGRFDRNEDGFLDLPLLTRYMIYNKWTYRSEKDEGLSLQAGVRFVHEKRIGGQRNFSEKNDKGSSVVYGQFVNYDQPEAFAKLNYRLSNRSVITMAASGSHHQQNAWFGITGYKAKQTLGYFNLQHELLWDDKYHLKYGASYRYQQLDENVDFSEVAPSRTYAGKYETQLRVPGFFAENTFSFADDRVMLIVGARADHQQKFGWEFTPRSMLKYAINTDHTFRASIGTGWRQVNLFSEQTMMLTSSRDIVFAEALRPEKALNWGISHTYKFVAGNTVGTISADFYRTVFSNQFFPDYDSDVSKIYVRNFTGDSKSNGLQVEAMLSFFKQLELRAAYNYLHVYQVKNNKKMVLPFNPKNRVMMAVSYQTKNKKWQADINGNWHDRMRLPDTQLNPEPYRRPSLSDAYTVVNTQLTHRFKKLELYGGCENVFNYVQPNPIISAENPFSTYFDLSSVWGPTRGREFYIGVRYSIK